MNNLETIRQAAIKANGENMFYSICSIHQVPLEYCENCTKGSYRSPSLADVLLAIRITNKVVMIDDNGYMFEMNKHNGIISESTFWDLTKTLEEQSEETLQFLADLLAEPNTTA